MLWNVTIALDEETLRWARIEAAKKGTSVSNLVGEMLDRERKTRFGAVAGPREEIYDRSHRPEDG